MMRNALLSIATLFVLAAGQVLLVSPVSAAASPAER